MTEQERDDLRNLVDSCQKEVTMTAVSLESLPNSRLEALEKLVDGYRQRMEQLEADPSLAHVDSEGNSDSVITLNESQKHYSEVSNIIKK